VSKWLGPVLIVAVFARHNLAWSLPGYSPQAWFYIMGGMLEILLCSTLLLMLPAQALIRSAMWIGILEGAQVSACRLATTGPIGKDANLCDALTGWHVGAIMTGVYLFIVCMAIGKEWRKREA
jgi:hypothetical protein